VLRAFTICLVPPLNAIIYGYGPMEGAHSEDNGGAFLKLKPGWSSSGNDPEVRIRAFSLRL
jgi:hypothetical protein